MDYQEFIDLVAKMRHHQREWFRAHNPNDLNEARRLEKAVDKAISDLKAGGTLF